MHEGQYSAERQHSGMLQLVRRPHPCQCIKRGVDIILLAQRSSNRAQCGGLAIG